MNIKDKGFEEEPGVVALLEQESLGRRVLIISLILFLFLALCLIFVKIAARGYWDMAEGNWGGALGSLNIMIGKINLLDKALTYALIVLGISIGVSIFWMIHKKNKKSIGPNPNVSSKPQILKNRTKGRYIRPNLSDKK